MLTIKNLYKIIAEDVVVSKNGANEFWIVDDVTELPDVYDIRVLREKNELGMYSVQITAAGHIIDKDQIRVRNIQTAEGMLGELKTIMELI